MTFGQLYAWWWGEYGSKRRSLANAANDSFVRKRIFPALEGLSLPQVTSAALEKTLQDLTEELSPRSLNYLLGIVSVVFSKARRRGIWPGANPAAGVERRRVPRKVFDTLRAEEVPLVLEFLDDRWRALFACAVWTGLRKGELLGLKKEDVDLDRGELTVRHSYGADTTKGGHADVIPIAEPLKPWLKQALAESRSELVFPRSDGKMHSHELPLQDVLRRALGRAGLVKGYQHVCRRKGCAFTEVRPDNLAKPCPKCSFRLWPKAIPRPLRFHDLRGTTGTLLARAGVGLVVAQRILRHADPRLTANIYSRVDMSDLRAGINRLGIPSATPIPLAASLDAQGFLPAVSPPTGFQKTKGPGAFDFSNHSGAFNESGRQDLNLRPLGPEPSALPG